MALHDGNHMLHYRGSDLNILHANTDPTLLARLKEMLGSHAQTRG